MFQFFIIKGILLLIYHFKIFCNKYIVVSFDHIQGPYLHKTKTHLQRVLGDENVLAVKFAKAEAGRRIFSYSMYHKIAREGIRVGSRRYFFFGKLFFMPCVYVLYIFGLFLFSYFYFSLLFELYCCSAAIQFRMCT